jgi:phosphatidyl-myo-inositol alpha-mannosyltransferase
MKIGLVLDDTLDKPDGVQQYVLTVGRWLANNGHEVHYLVGQSTRTDVPHIHSLAHNVGVTFNGNHLSIPLPVSKTKLRRLLEQERFDVLHVQTPHSPFMAQRLIMSTPDTTAIVATFHIMPHSPMVSRLTKLLGWWLRPSLSRINHIVAVSAAAQQFCLEAFGRQSTVVPNAIEVARFADATGFSRYAGKPTVVFLNRLVERKGCQYLLKAVNQLIEMDDVPPFRVVVCGKGMLLPHLQKYVEEQGLEDVVSFTGFVTEKDKPRYLASADIAVFPSTGGESFGIVVAEALAAAKGPVLGGNNPGYATVLAPFPEQLFDPRDTTALAQLLHGHLQKVTGRTRIAKRQKRHVQQFDVQAVGTKLLTIYQDALHAKQNMRQ